MNWCHEVQRLKAKYESLKETQRHLLGEDLGPLNVKELENLEKQLESALVQARHRKMQLMAEQMESHRRKIEEGVVAGQFRMMNPQFPGWGFGATPVASSSFSVHHPSHSATTALDCDPAALQIGYKPEPILEIGYQCYAAQEEAGPSNPRNMATDFHGCATPELVWTPARNSHLFVCTSCYHGSRSICTGNRDQGSCC